MDKASKGSNAVKGLLSPDMLLLVNKGDRAVLLVAGLIVIICLAAIPNLMGSPRLLVVVALVTMAGIGLLFYFLPWRKGKMQDVEADITRMNAAAAAINGDWWQVVYDKGHPGLTWVRIILSPIAERSAMQGIAFDEKGDRHARWSSDAVAIKSSTPVELYYVWRGIKLRDDDASLISGIGRFRFDSIGSEDQPREGEGLFAASKRGELRLDLPVSVELFRFSDDDIKAFKAGGSAQREAVAKAFVAFQHRGSGIMPSPE